MTMIADDAIHAEWLPWAKAHLAQQVMDAGKFTSSRFLRVLDSPNEGTTYCLQFVSDALATVDEYLYRSHPAIEDAVRQRFGEGLLVFITVMEYID